MKGITKKIVSIITSLLIHGSCSTLKALDEHQYDSFEDLSDDYEDDTDDCDLESEEENIYENYSNYDEINKDCKSWLLNYVTNNPYKFFKYGLVAMSTLGAIKSIGYAYDAIKDEGGINLGRYADDLILKVRKEINEKEIQIPDVSVSNLFTFQKIAILQQASVEITANMFREVLPCENDLVFNSNEAKAVLIGIKDVIYAKTRIKDKKKLLSHLMKKWSLKKEWACYQCAVTLKLIADHLDLKNCIMKDESNHVTLLIPVRSPYLYNVKKKDYENVGVPDGKMVLQFGGDVQEYCGSREGGSGGRRFYGLNKGDTLYIPNGKREVYKVTEKRWEKKQNKKGEIIPKNPRWSSIAFDELMDIISNPVQDRNFLKKIDAKNGFYDSLLYDLCEYSK